MFQPVIPLSGIGGWKFLQSTYERQFDSFTKSPQVRNDRDYLIEKFSDPISVDDFLSDRRLLRATMTAFDLAGEEWKGGFIRKALEEVADPESTFLARLNNSKYTKLAETLQPIDGKIYLSPDDVAKIAVRFETSSFELAVGDVDDNMRLSLNYQSELADIANEGSSETAVLYRILGDVPMRTVLQTTLSLPSDISKLTIERQAEILKDKLSSTLGISDVHDLNSPEMIEKVINRFHAIESISGGPSSYTPASAALTLLSNGVGSQASENLFLSLLL